MRKKNDEMSDGARIFCFCIGIYLIVGAGFTVYEGKWFIGFPPQLDVAYFLLGSSTTGAYVEAIIATVIGLLFVFGSMVKSKVAHRPNVDEQPPSSNKEL